MSKEIPETSPEKHVEDEVDDCVKPGDNDLEILGELVRPFLKSWSREINQDIKTDGCCAGDQAVCVRSFLGETIVSSKGNRISQDIPNKIKSNYLSFRQCL